jgi:hypothetical protein
MKNPENRPASTAAVDPGIFTEQIPHLVTALSEAEAVQDGQVVTMPAADWERIVAALIEPLVMKAILERSPFRMAAANLAARGQSTSKALAALRAALGVNHSGVASAYRCPAHSHLPSPLSSHHLQAAQLAMSKQHLVSLQKAILSSMSSPPAKDSQGRYLERATLKPERDPPPPPPGKGGHHAE